VSPGKPAVTTEEDDSIPTGCAGQVGWWFRRRLAVPLLRRRRHMRALLFHHVTFESSKTALGLPVMSCCSLPVYGASINSCVTSVTHRFRMPRPPPSLRTQPHSAGAFPCRMFRPLPASTATGAKSSDRPTGRPAQVVRETHYRMVALDVRRLQGSADSRSICSKMPAFGRTDGWTYRGRMLCLVRTERAVDDEALPLQILHQLDSTQTGPGRRDGAHFGVTCRRNIEIE
jgi:hypothetical protein